MELPEKVQNKPNDNSASDIDVKIRTKTSDGNFKDTNSDKANLLSTSLDQLFKKSVNQHVEELAMEQGMATDHKLTSYNGNSDKNDNVSFGSAVPPTNTPQECRPDPLATVTNSAPSEGFASGLKFSFSCKFCDKYYVERKTMIKHIRQAHKFENVTIDHYSPGYREPARNKSVAPKVVPEAPEGFDELKIHYGCVFCDKFYTTLANVKKHIKKAHLLEYVMDDHYKTCMMQPKQTRVKSAVDAKMKPKFFVTPRKDVEPVQKENPGEYGAAEQSLVGGVVQVPLGEMVQAPLGGFINLPVEGLSSLPLHAPDHQDHRGQVQHQPAGQVKVPLKTGGKVKSKKRRLKNNTKIGFYKELENIIMDPTKNEKFQLWKTKKSHITESVNTANIVTQPRSVIPVILETRPNSVIQANISTQPKNLIPANIVTELIRAIPANIVTEPNSLTPVNIETESTSVIQPESLRPFPSSPISLPPLDLIPPPPSVEASNGSENSEQTVKRGKRPSVPSVPSGRGRGRIKKCGLASCLPCSFETDCGKCPQCTNKKMK